MRKEGGNKAAPAQGPGRQRGPRPGSNRNAVACREFKTQAQASVPVEPQAAFGMAKREVRADLDRPVRVCSPRSASPRPRHAFMRDGPLAGRISPGMIGPELRIR